jgi:glutamate synthase (NADPH/NADH) large chain
VVAQDHGLEKALDNKLIELARPALDTGVPVHADLAVRNDQRSVGAMLGGEVARRYGGNGLPDDTIAFTLNGTGGQSFGAFLPRGVTLRLIGDTNDYVAKGLSGGRVVVRPADEAPFTAEDNIIAGNTILYGATGGEVYLRGRAGERFAVRNSGAHAVVEGVGDHGCEYMTGGVVVVLGSTGRNFAAGMSGGTAFVLDLNPALVNPELVDLAPLTADEEETLHELVRKHGEETGSAVAQRLLKDWSTAVGEFTAVVPRDYKRVMELIRTAEAAGRNVDEAVMGGKSA